MTNKLYSISVYDYVNMLCEATGCKWPDELPKDLYNGFDNSNTINGQTKTKK